MHGETGRVSALFQQLQGRNSGGAVGVSSVYGVKMDANIFDSSSEVIQTEEGKAIGVEQVEAS